MAIDLDAPKARPIWDRALDPSVVAVSTSCATVNNPFDVRALGEQATIVRTRTAQEHLLLSKGPQHLRFDVIEGTLLAGPVALRFMLADGPALPVQIETLRRWHKFRNGWNFASIAKYERRAPVWVRQLRAYDGTSAGATMREIALTLFPVVAATSALDDRNDALRSVIRRLVKNARANVAGGYRRILSGYG